MTITEQGRRWEVKEAMRVTMREQRRQRDELWRIENNNRNWMALSAHARGDRSLPSQFKEVHQSGSTTGVWNLVLIVKLLRGRRRRRRKTFKTSSAGKAHPSVIGACANAPHAFQKLCKHSSKIKKEKETRVTDSGASAHTVPRWEDKQSRARPKPAKEKKGEKGGKKGGRESILKFSSWQALIFRHSN